MIAAAREPETSIACPPIAAAASSTSVTWPVPDPGFGNKAFTGREWDPETGLYYYRARYYDPKAGRFISEDPIGFDGDGPNFYAYVLNNPAVFIDPSGEWASEEERSLIRETLQEDRDRIFGKDLENLDFSYATPGGAVAGSLKIVGARALLRCKAVNLPAWKRIGIDMKHILSGHTKGGSRASALKDLFPESMSPKAIERAIREAYRHGKNLGSQGERVFVEGATKAGLTIEMWVNKATKMIESAWPK